MGKIGIILLFLCILIKKSYCECNNDECYKYYKNFINQDKVDIEKEFDGILEKYGDIEGILTNLLYNLNKTIVRADDGINNFEKDNTDIKNAINRTNSLIQDLLNEVKVIESDLKNINDSKGWPDQISNATKTADLIIPSPPTLEDVKGKQDELEKWKQYLKQFEEGNYTKNIMNIPYSVSDDLDVLETLLNEDYDTNCFNKFHEDLKRLFAQLINILNIDGAHQNLTDLKNRADKTKEKGDEIVAKTEEFLKKEKDFKNTHDLANDILTLAEEIEELKYNIDRLLRNNEEIFDEKLKELLNSHKSDLEELYKKYKICDYDTLIEELKDINKQIEEIGGEKDVNIADIEAEIEKYVNDIDYYTCILNDCRYRQPAEAVVTFNCKRKTD